MRKLERFENVQVDTKLCGAAKSCALQSTTTDRILRDKSRVGLTC